MITVVCISLDACDTEKTVFVCISVDGKQDLAQARMVLYPGPTYSALHVSLCELIL